MLLRMAEMNVEGPSIAVLHRDPGRYNSFVSQYQSSFSTSSSSSTFYIVGRSMYETNKIPHNWVSKCNDLVSEVWVPSQFNIRTFSESGVTLSKLSTLPEAIDTHLYDPKLHPPLNILVRFYFSH